MTTPARRTALAAMAVVIPARDEEDLIARCLTSVREAIAEAGRVLGSAAPAVCVVVVADRCLDSTAQIARAFDEIHVVELDAANVGRARAAGVRHALARIDHPLDRTWIANTDADSVVPPNWITEQAALARTRVGMMVGTVRPDFRDLEDRQREAWLATRIPGRANGHVHGANLGVRADLYVGAGTFPSLAEHEDVALAERVTLLGARVVATDRCEVFTSGRGEGRTPGGYAGYLSTGLVADTPGGSRDTVLAAEGIS